MSISSTRAALLEQGALLYAQHGVAGVSNRTLHEAVGARNQSALHYHFGTQAELVQEIVRLHLAAVERRRALLVEDLRARGETGDLRGLVRALAQPMADDLHDPVGRAHLRIVAQLSHPALAYDAAFRSARDVDVDAAAGTTVVAWLQQAMPRLPGPVRVERLADLRGHLLTSFGQRARLIEDDPEHGEPREVRHHVENLLDALVAALTVPPSTSTLRAARAVSALRRSRPGS